MNLLFYLPTLLLMNYLDAAAPNCPIGCTCKNDTLNGLNMPQSGLVVECMEGGVNQKALSQLLDRMPKLVAAVKITGKPANPNSFSYTPGFSRLRQLSELHLVECGMRSLGKGALRHMDALRTLVVARNDIEFISTETFDGAENLRRLDLSGNRLGGSMLLPTGAFRQLTQLTHLSLADNGLKALPVNLLGTQSNRLHTINLSGNRLRSSDVAKLLANAPNLRSISLARQNISDLKPNIFKNSPFLEEIDLSGNKLAHVPSLALRGLVQLGALDLSANGIDYIGPHAFHGMRINRLTLARNNLGSCFNMGAAKRYGTDGKGMHPDAFTGIKSLAAIDLSYNRFSDFHPASVLGSYVATGLTWLSVEGNNLGPSMLPRFTDSLDSLTHLNMANTGMQLLGDKLPEQFEQLRSLNLSRNHLAAITPGAVNAFRRHLHTLDISDNVLRNMADYLYSGLVLGLPQLYLAGNPFDCHCHIVPLQQFLLQRAAERHDPGLDRDLDGVRCASPAKFRGMRVSDVSRPPDCAILLRSVAGLTQRSELGIMGALAFALVAVMGGALLSVYVARSWRRHGVYHTRESQAQRRLVLRGAVGDQYSDSTSDSNGAALTHSDWALSHNGSSPSEKLC